MVRGPKMNTISIGLTKCQLVKINAHGVWGEEKMSLDFTLV